MPRQIKLKKYNFKAKYFKDYYKAYPVTTNASSKTVYQNNKAPNFYTAHHYKSLKARKTKLT